MNIKGDILVVHAKAKFLLRNKEVKLLAMSSNQNYIFFVEVKSRNVLTNTDTSLDYLVWCL